MARDDWPPFFGLLGLVENTRIPARVDLDGDLKLTSLVDRLEIGLLAFFGQLLVFGLFTDLVATAQVGIAGAVVVLLDIVDRKVVSRFIG